MSNKHSKNTLLSRVSGSKKLQKIIVYVEGRNTEQSYIQQLRKSNLKVKPVVKKGHGIGRCMDFVSDSIKAFDSLPSKTRGEYTQKWLMFDYDGRSDFASAINFARKKGFQVAISSMCIEYWFLLHFQDHDGKPIPCKNNDHSSAQIEILNNHIDKYNKSLQLNQANVKRYDTQKNVEEDLFELLMAVNPVTHHRRVEDACNRSSKIHKIKCANGAEFNESVTTMYKFLEIIGFVSCDKDGNYTI